MDVEQEDPSSSEPGSDGFDRGDRFKVLYGVQFPNVYAFVVRRLLGSRDDALDVTAEVFATAWRRRDQIPPAPGDRLWIYAVAGRVLSRHQRGVLRRWRLHWRLRAEQITRGSGDDDSAVVDREVIQSAIARLRPSDRDVLGLVFWEQLSHAETAKVLHCSTNAVALRLNKAKRRLRRELASSGSQSSERPTRIDEEKRPR